MVVNLLLLVMGYSRLGIRLDEVRFGESGGGGGSRTPVRSLVGLLIYMLSPNWKNSW